MPVGFQPFNPFQQLPFAQRMPQPVETQFPGFQDVAQIAPQDVAEVDDQSPLSGQQLINPIAPPQNKTDMQSDLGNATMGDFPSEDAIARRMKLAEALMGDQQEVHHPTQAIANALNKIMGAWQQKKAQDDITRVENSRRNTLKTALEAHPDNLGAIMNDLAKSGDPKLVDMWLDTSLKSLSAENRRDNRNPYVRRFREGEDDVDKQYNPETGGWDELSRAPHADQNPNAVLDDETADFMAGQYLAGDKSVLTNLGRGRQGPENVIKIRRAIARIVTENGGTPKDVAYAIAKFSRQTAAQRTLGTREAQFGLAANEAQRTGGLVRSTSRKVPRGQFVPLNRAIQAYQRQTGDPNIVAFGSALNTFMNAYVRAVQPTGVPTDELRKKAWNLLSTANSQEQLDAVMDVLEQEMVAAGAAIEDTGDELESRFTGNEPKQKQQATTPNQKPSPAPGTPNPKNPKYVWGTDRYGKDGWIEK